MGRTLFNGAEQFLADSVPWSAMQTGQIVPPGALDAGTPAQFLLTNSSGVATWTGLSGDISLSSAGTASVNAAGGKSISLGGALATGAALTLSGAFATTLNVGATTNLTLPPGPATVTALGNTTTGSGSIVLGTSPTLTGAAITLNADPTVPLGAATMQFVQNAVANAQAGLSPKSPAICATTGALPAYSYSNGSSGSGATITFSATGAMAIDGHTLASGDRVLVKNESGGNAAYNGVYSVTTAPASGVAGVLTRTTDDNSAATMPGAYVYVQAGSTNAGTGWYCNDAIGSVTVGTTAISFVQFSGGGSLSALAPFSLIGNQLSLISNGVGLGYLSQAPAQTLVGNGSGSTGNLSTLTLAGSLSLSGGALTTAALSGDVTSSAGSFATTVHSVGGQSVSLGGAFTTTGGSLTFSLSGNTSISLPQSGGGLLVHGNFIFNEIPAGTLNSANTAFTLAHTPATDANGNPSLWLFYDGEYLDLGASNDFTISGPNITTTWAPSSAGKLRACYLI